MTASASATAGLTSVDGIGAPPEGTAVRVRGVTKVHGRGVGAVTALEGISLEVAKGEIVCLVGASGCGKSTLLSLLAGLDKPTSGTVEVNAGLRIRGGLRTPALMFQEAALFPWLSVERNIELALRLRGRPKAERKAKTERLLGQVQLTGFERKHPHQLSGGMRQRAALARALAQEAEVLLFDEPFGALDAITRDVLHDELERVLLAEGLSAIFVTHDVREAVRLGDRVLVLSSRPGRVVAEHRVDLPRPRRGDDPAIAAQAGELLDRLRTEVARHGRA